MRPPNTNWWRMSRRPAGSAGAPAASSAATAGSATSAPTTGAAPAASGVADPVGSPPPVCDLHKVDWKNVSIPGGLTFTGGGASSGDTAWGPAKQDCGLNNAEYADLDGNGSHEAYLSINCNPGQSIGSNDQTFAVVEMGRNCALRSLTTIDGGPEATGKVVGRSYVVDVTYGKDGDPECFWTGLRRDTYRVSKGKFTSTSQTIK